MRSLKELQKTPNINTMLEDGYIIGLKAFLKSIDEKLTDIEFTMDRDEDLDLEHINQLIGRREQLNELRKEVQGD